MPRGGCCASLAGGKSALRLQPVSLQRFLPPHWRLASAFRLCNQLYGLCHGEGFFHGSPCLATDDSLACVIATADFLLMALRWISKYSECQSPKRQGCLYPCQQSEATFDWPSRATTHRCILPFRSEFTPLDTLRFLFSPVSHPYRGNTTVIDG